MALPLFGLILTCVIEERGRLAPVKAIHESAKSRRFGNDLKKNLFVYYVRRDVPRLDSRLPRSVIRDGTSGDAARFSGRDPRCAGSENTGAGATVGELPCEPDTDHFPAAQV